MSILFKSRKMFFILSVVVLVFSSHRVYGSNSFLKDSTDVILGRIYFQKGKNKLTAESKKVLSEIAKRMLNEPHLLLDIKGYTDNTGTKYSNIILSKKRALVVRKYLVDSFGIPKERMFVIGMGEQNPIASNDTEEGRAKNRRVEIAVHRPDAVLAWFRNEVGIQPPFMVPEWLNPHRNTYLYKLYKVKTGRKSGADILFPKKGILNIGDDALVIIYGLSSKPGGEKVVKNIQLQKGGLRSMLTQLSAQEDFTINTPAAVVELHSKDSRISVDKSLKSLISVYEGHANVSAMGKKVRVNEGMGTVVEKGKPPEDPKPLPDTPKIVEPKRDYYIKGLSHNVVFKWQPTSLLSHIQIARDSLFHEMILDTCLPSDTFSFKIGKGSFYWRVSGIDEYSLEGAFSKCVKFEVLTDTVKPKVDAKILREGEGLFKITGKTEASAKIYINGKEVETNGDGSFSYHFKTRGNDITIKAIDKAGNVTEKIYRVSQRPGLYSGISIGEFSLTPHDRYNPEFGYYYGLELEKAIGTNNAIVFNVTRGTISKEIEDTTTFTTTIVPVEIGLHHFFHHPFNWDKINWDRITPFIGCQAGFLWWRNVSNEGITGERFGNIANFLIGMRIGAKVHITHKFWLNIFYGYSYFTNFNKPSFGKEVADILVHYNVSLQLRLR